MAKISPEDVQPLTYMGIGFAIVLALILTGWVPLVATVFAVICAFMILVILIQRPKGGGLAGAFGGAGGGVQGAFGAKTGDWLTLFTVGLFTLFLLAAIQLTYKIRPTEAEANTPAMTAGDGEQPEAEASESVDQVEDETDGGQDLTAEEVMEATPSPGQPIDDLMPEPGAGAEEAGEAAARQAEAVAEPEPPQTQPADPAPNQPQETAEQAETDETAPAEASPAEPAAEPQSRGPSQADHAALASARRPFWSVSESRP